jgi:hypothetical protein
VEGSEAKHRAKYAIKALLYFGVAATALAILLANAGVDSGGAGGGGGKERATATVLSWPAGPWIVGLAGVAIVALALQQVRKHGWKQEFMERLERSRMNDKVARGVRRAGQAGYTARAIVLAITGVFLVVAAVQHDPDEAKGLSGALRALSGETWGQIVLWLVAVGLVLYGIFCFAEARYRRAT